MEVVRCKSCNAEISWILTASGRAMPVDAKPEKRIVIDRGAQYSGRVLDTYTSHFATCPHADQHRKD
jgi:hypothetical protein